MFSPSVKKIVIIAHHLSAPGTEAYWVEYLKHSSDQLVIIRPKYWKDGGALKPTYNPELLMHGIEFKSFSAPFSRFSKQNLYFFINIFGFYRILRNVNPDLIYVMNTSNSIICLQTTIIAKLLGLKVIGWASRLEPRNFFITFGLVKGLIFSAVRMLNIKFLDGIHATSQKARTALVDEGHVCPIYIAPTHGIPAHFVNKKPKFENRLNSQIIIGYAGELRDFKGVDILIRSIGKVKPGVMKLIVAGIGPEKNKLLELAKDIGIEIEFCGYIPNIEMPKFYKRCDVFVLPSKGNGIIIEKFGRVLIEAAACGCAVVGSNVGGIPLALGSQGLIFKDRSVESLALILETLLDEHVLHKHKVRCQEYALSNFSMAVVSKKFYEAVVRKIL